MWWCVCVLGRDLCARSTYRCVHRSAHEPAGVCARACVHGVWLEGCGLSRPVSCPEPGGHPGRLTSLPGRCPWSRGRKCQKPAPALLSASASSRVSSPGLGVFSLFLPWINLLGGEALMGLYV